MVRLLPLLAGALLLGAGATWASARWLEQAAAARAAPPPVPMVQLLVAARDLAPGDRLDDGSVSAVPWPAASIRPGHLRADDPRPEGPLRLAVAAGEPLLQGHFTAAGAGGVLAALVRPGARAVTLAVSADGAVAGLAAPGDRVDVILTAGVAGGGRIVARTVVEDVRLLGIDQSLSVAEPLLPDPDQMHDVSAAPATVTLEVSPVEARALAVAAEMGRLRLSLRTPGDRARAAANETTWDTDVTKLEALALAVPAAGLEAAPVAGAVAAATLPTAAISAALPAPAGTPGDGGAPRVERRNGVDVVRGSRSAPDAAPEAPVDSAAPPK